MSPLEILLVEDDPEDQRLVQEALTESPVPVRLRVVPDGAAALAFLRHEAPMRLRLSLISSSWI
jgi:CheY-like chemotaxis protein